eukprot:349990-Chlamydomonas_euryale.AAC.7
MGHTARVSKHACWAGSPAHQEQGFTTCRAPTAACGSAASPTAPRYSARDCAIGRKPTRARCLSRCAQSHCARPHSPCLPIRMPFFISAGSRLAAANGRARCPATVPRRGGVAPCSWRTWHRGGAIIASAAEVSVTTVKPDAVLCGAYPSTSPCHAAMHAPGIPPLLAPAQILCPPVDSSWECSREGAARHSSAAPAGTPNVKHAWPRLCDVERTVPRAALAMALPDPPRLLPAALTPTHARRAAGAAPAPGVPRRVPCGSTAATRQEGSGARGLWPDGSAVWVAVASGISSVVRNLLQQHQMGNSHPCTAWWLACMHNFCAPKMRLMWDPGHRVLKCKTL